MSLLSNLAELYGTHNIEVSVQMTPLRRALFITYKNHNDEPVMVPCRILEDRYKVADNYKITLDSKVPGFGHEHFYQMDLETMIEQGSASVRVLIHDDRGYHDNR